MFHSKVVTKQWDTWAFVENGTFYAYYLVTEVSYGEGFGCASSPDGQHWTDHGYVWHGPSWVQQKWWEGTSSIWRASDWNTTGRYLINYSVMHPEGYQNITFAESFDLIHWSSPAPYNSTWFNIDPTVGYRVDHGRWDTIYSIPVDHTQNPRDGYPRYGYWTASPVNGTMGFGITNDGYNWKALESPQMLPKPIGAEVGAVEWHQPSGIYIAMLGYGWPRTMLTYTSKSALGPFTRATTNVNFLNGSCYYSRFFRGPNQELLITHQSWTNRGSHYAYIAPYKLADVDENGTFRLKWWNKNEGLKGTEVLVVLNGSYFEGAANVSQGAILEATFTLSGTSDPASWPGFLLKTHNSGALFVGMQNDGLCVVGNYKSFSPAAYINYSTSQVQVPTNNSIGDWEYEGGASNGPSRRHGDNDVRSGGPGQKSMALVAHPLFSEGHLITSVSMSFQYVSGYSCFPGDCANASTLSLAVVDAFNHSVVSIVWTSPPLNNYSYDKFTSYSPPIFGGAANLSIGWEHQTQLALLFTNNKRNLQIPLSTLNVTIGWGGMQRQPWQPSSITNIEIKERWGRGFSWKQGQQIKTRLLVRRDMLEFYANDFLFPVYAMSAGTGDMGLTNTSIVTNVRRWAMSLPAEATEH